MKKVFLIMAVALGLTACTQKDDYFKPVYTSDLRLPSVPIVVSYPYFSIWSPYDKLNEGSTEHWSSAKKSILGVLRVDGKNYRFLGKEQKRFIPIAAMATSEQWEGKYTRETPSANWVNEDFDDSSWQTGGGAFGSRDRAYVRTEWSGDNTDIYVRRYFNLDSIAEGAKFYIHYSHDDVFALYLNGERIVQTGNTWLDNEEIELTPEQVAKLRKGRNVIAAHGHNTVGGSFVDFSISYLPAKSFGFETEAVQKSVNVMATSSYYTFECGPVQLELVFTAPQLIDDLDLLSTPINYVSYKVTSLDSKEHDVQLMLQTTPELATNDAGQPTVANYVSRNGINYVKAGTIEQPICAKKGDLICQDWGYVYLAAANENGKEVSLGNLDEVKKSFAESGKLPETKDTMITRKVVDMPALAYSHDLGTVGKSGKQSFTMIGYDDVYSLEYLYKLYKGYWAHNGQVTIYDAFGKLLRGYDNIMQRCRVLDKRIYDDAFNSGGKKYAELCAASYRHVISAHKLFEDSEGHLLFFSKENNSNGCINTVDLTYPSAPLFFLYNPELVKAMMTSILEYSASGRWTKPFAAHDMGTYPIANGQVYGGDMPLEESGNILTLLAEICRTDGNAEYAKPYWDILTTWVDYLVENGQDPENQLCTDDFAGHWAHNANLSVKAIMGIAAYSEIARIMGKDDVAEKYLAKASEMAKKWEEMARDGDHYRLAFDRPDTWSQKYNMVWDKMWNTNIFPKEVMQKEIAYYLTKQEKYGLPLDCRKKYTKSDWIMWTAAMADDQKTFQQFLDPLYKYVDETPTRVPISDWYNTDDATWQSFRARSVIGGHWMKVLMDRELAENNANK